MLRSPEKMMIGPVTGNNKSPQLALKSTESPQDDYRSFCILSTQYIHTSIERHDLNIQ